MKTWIAAGVMVLVCATAASAGKYGNLTEHANGKSVATAPSSLVVPNGPFTAQFPMTAARLAGSEQLDGNTSDHSEWAASDTQSGPFVTSAGSTIWLYTRTAAEGLEIATFTDPINQLMWVPGFIVTVSGLTRPCITGWPVGPNYCQPYAVTVGADDFTLTTSAIPGENSSNLAWGIYAPWVPYMTGGNPLCTNSGPVRFGSPIAPGCFDVWMPNVSIYAVANNVNVPNGAPAIASTPHGLIPGYISSNVFRTALVEWNSGVPPDVGGEDWQTGGIAFQAESGQYLNRYWTFQPSSVTEHFMSGDIGSNVYVYTHQVGCMAPLGRILSTNQYDALQSVNKQGPIVEAYHPNVYHPYYTRTGQVLQPLGSCTAQYP